MIKQKKIINSTGDRKAEEICIHIGALTRNEGLKKSSINNRLSVLK